MPVVKKRNQQTETRLLLESNEPVELPPAEIEDGAVLVQFYLCDSWVDADLLGQTVARRR
jgi:hypothetical protein